MMCTLTLSRCACIVALLLATLASAAVFAQSGGAQTNHEPIGLDGLVSDQQQSDGFQHFIVGGRVVNDMVRYPFMAAVYFDITGKGTFRPGCGGSLIADRWVLTAAHCLYNNDFDRPESADRIAVLLGTTNLVRQEGTFINAVRLILHPGYDRQTNQNDIALIELENPFPSPLAVLPAVDSPVPTSDDNGIVLGWGALAESGLPSINLREVSLPIFNSAACYPHYRFGFDSRVAFCAGGVRDGGLDSCQGDSGGPLLVVRDSAYVVAGIVSYGDGCGRAGVPGVYTRVEAFTDWITSHTSGTLEYVGQQNAQNAENAVIARVEVNTSVAGNIASRENDLYEITGASQVTLTSNSGDADLYIINTTDFNEISSASVFCISETPGPLDICTLRNPSQVAYAVVYGFSDASYTLTTQAIVDDAENVQAFDADGRPVLEDGGSAGGGGAVLLLIPLLMSVRVVRRRIVRV